MSIIIVTLYVFLFNECFDAVFNHYDIRFEQLHVPDYVLDQVLVSLYFPRFHDPNYYRVYYVLPFNFYL